jgi:uncharacterized membrane protein
MTRDRSNAMIALARSFAMLSLTLTGAIFGFFYAWVCSTMWGLDQADPRVAIEAMQAVNASVRNLVFAPSFFGTPLAAAAAAATAWAVGARKAALAFAAAAVVYLAGGVVLTFQVNVPMNEALAAARVPAALDEARKLWTDYSSVWQRWNVLRTIASGVALLLNGLGVYWLGDSAAHRVGTPDPTRP